MSDFIWTGNPLTKSGTRCRYESIEAELVHVDPYLFDSKVWGGRPPTIIRRSWWLHIHDAESMRIGNPDNCLLSVVLVDLLPEPAKREAEIVIGWAAAVYKVYPQPGEPK